MNLKIQIALNENRSMLGKLRAVRSDTHEVIVSACDCLGLSDNEYAVLQHNPTKDPLRKGGNTPYGGYVADAERFKPPISESTQHTYGSAGLFHLSAVFGDALKACSTYDPVTSIGGRSGICIHGGVLNSAYVEWKGLRPTHGCVRALDSTILLLLDTVEVLKPQSVECEVAVLFMDW